jgi:hypothetical protein
LQAAALVSDRSGLAAGGGDIINIPFTSAVNARAKAASTNITYDSPEGAPVTVQIDKHYYVGVLIEDIVKVQSNYELESAFKNRMAEALARQLDTDILALYTSAGTSVAGGAAIDDADILAVVAAFDATNTPQSMRRGILGPNSKIDLLGINKYNAYDQTGRPGTAVSKTDGLRLGSVYNMDLYMSQNVPTSTTGRNLFFHKDAITKVEQKKPEFWIEKSVDALGWKTALSTVYGVGAVRPAQIVELTRTTAP